MIHISIAAETITTLWGISITNSLLSSILISLVLIGAALLIRQNLRMEATGWQILIETILGAIYELVESITPNRVEEFFPLITTLFLFILASNWFGLIPGIGDFGINRGAEFVPLFRATTADLNTTLALAVISVAAIQYYGLKHLGIKLHLSRFFNIQSVLGFFVGLLEFVSELAKIISFSFRLFGNIFAGEVLLVVIGSLIPLIAPLPFLGLEVFVGFIQALVFAVLTLAFISIAVEHPH